MKPTADDITRHVIDLSNECLDGCLARIRHCVGQLSDAQVWWRPEESMNSIANLILHLTGNVRQWIVTGIGGATDIRVRPAEFSERGPIPPSQLLNELQAAIDSAKRALSTATAEDMIRQRRIQGYNVTGFGALFDCIPHFKGHTQEIICLTRMQLGDNYAFYWQPQTPEQGAP
jgi:Protein of unknown function (DUF1572)